MDRERIAVIGLGYVGLPLAVSLAREFDVLGFDVSAERIDDLRAGNDVTREVSAETLQASNLQLSVDAADLTQRSVYIVTVPTPIDDSNRPDFSALLKACELVGPALDQGSVVVFESTVYPGVTEEICGPALERASGKRCGIDFKLGYSPERINPGDRQHSLEKVVKIVAGQDEETLARLSAIYGAIIEAGIHQAPSIKVAEAAKVLENTQRDVNIALMNEVSKICDLLGIRSSDVLGAAGTKWNFLKFQPGLVGGHCIGVDPYYLTAKAEELGYQPEVILSGRRVNDSMGAYVAQRLMDLLSHQQVPHAQLRIGILGLTFKENIPDVRNSKVVDICGELTALGLSPLIHDPVATSASVTEHYGRTPVSIDAFHGLHGVVLAVPHRDYLELPPSRLSDMLVSGGVLVDVKSVVEPAGLRSDIRYWSL